MAEGATLPTRSITLHAGLYHIEGIPVYLPTTKGEVHTANAKSLQDLIAKSATAGKIQTTEDAENQAATADDFKSQVESKFSAIDQNIQATQIVLQGLGDTLKAINDRLTPPPAPAEPAAPEKAESKGSKGDAKKS